MTPARRSSCASSRSTKRGILRRKSFIFWILDFGLWIGSRFETPGGPQSKIANPKSKIVFPSPAQLLHQPFQLGLLARIGLQEEGAAEAAEGRVAVFQLVEVDGPFRLPQVGPVGSDPQELLVEQ